MLNLIIKYFYNPKYGIPFIILSSLFFSIFFSYLSFEYLQNHINFYLLFFFFFVIYFIIIEILFLLVYLFKNKTFYYPPSKVGFDKIPYKGHPYIPYLLKEKVEGTPPSAVIYPLHKGKYKDHKVRTNNLGFLNGINGDRDVPALKKKNSIRINCIGSSTTMNYLVYKDKVYSYPLELENILNSDSKISYEVNNCGQGGYNTADIMVRFLLQILDTKPDLIILYQGHADIRSYLSDNFKSDYSHSRYNLSEFYTQLKFNTKIPKMPLSFLNFLISHWFPYNLANSLVDLIHKEKINIKSNHEKGLQTFERNLQIIIDICIAKKIKLIMSTYCNILYDEIKDSPLHIKYSKIMNDENEVIKKLAYKNNIFFVDNANLIPKDIEFFVDTIHFSHKGMEALASNFAKKIKSIYEE